jgi:hypothetical protein
MTVAANLARLAAPLAARRTMVARAAESGGRIDADLAGWTAAIRPVLLVPHLRAVLARILGTTEAARKVGALRSRLAAEGAARRPVVRRADVERMAQRCDNGQTIAHIGIVYKGGIATWNRGRRLSDVGAAAMRRSAILNTYS